jgi:hypothetical protein
MSHDHHDDQIANHPAWLTFFCDIRHEHNDGRIANRPGWTTIRSSTNKLNSIGICDFEKRTFFISF